MRIARVLTRLNLGGPARQVLASDPGLQQRGHQLRVFAGSSAPGEGDLFQLARERGIDVVRVPGLQRGIAPLADWRALRGLQRALAEFDPDVVHTHASKAGALGRRAAPVRAVRVHTFHGHVLEGYFPALIARRLIAEETRLARITERVVAVSHATADDLLRLGVVSPERLVVIPPGIELEPFLSIQRGAGPRPPGPLRALLGAAPEVLLVGVIGRLAAVKRPALALQAFLTIAARQPLLQLCFVGDGEQRRQLEGLIQALAPELQKRVHMLGARDDMPAVYAELDLLLLASRSEGLPVALIEAGAAALPAVAMDVGGVSEVLVHERTGLLGSSVDELARGLDLLASKAQLRAALGARARLRVQERHSAVLLAQRLEALYAAVTEEGRCAS